MDEKMEIRNVAGAVLSHRTGDGGDKRMRKIIALTFVGLTAFIIILTSTPVFSQINPGIVPSPVNGQCVIYGKVVSWDSGQPLANVLVAAYAGHGGRGAITDQAEISI